MHNQYCHCIDCFQNLGCGTYGVDDPNNYKAAKKWRENHWQHTLEIEREYKHKKHIDGQKGHYKEFKTGKIKCLDDNRRLKERVKNRAEEQQKKQKRAQDKADKIQLKQLRRQKYHHPKESWQQIGSKQLAPALKEYHKETAQQKIAKILGQDEFQLWNGRMLDTAQQLRDHEDVEDVVYDIKTDTGLWLQMKRSSKLYPGQKIYYKKSTKFSNIQPKQEPVDEDEEMDDLLIEWQQKAPKITFQQFMADYHQINF